MTFAPTKKHSKTRSNRRTSNWIKITAKKLANRVALQYEDGKAIGLAQVTSPLTGKYNGRQVLKLKTKKVQKTRV